MLKSPAQWGFVYFCFQFCKFLTHIYYSFIPIHLGLLRLFVGLTPLSLYSVTLCLWYFFVVFLKSALYDINIATFAFFDYVCMVHPFTFHPFTFIPCIALYLKLVPWRQYGWIMFFILFARSLYFNWYI